MADQYAFPADYFRFIGEVMPDNLTEGDILKINAGLRRATTRVKRDTRLAIIRYDVNGNAVDTRVAVALREATCAAYDWFEITGDYTGALDKFDSVSMAGVVLARRATAQSTNSAASSRVSPEEIEILMAAGIYSTYVRDAS